MDIRERIANAKSPEEMEKYLLDLDSEFRFKCRRCGKCCKNQDTILFNARDIYNIAKKIGKTPKQVIEECAEVYIGDSSRIPVVHMVPVGLQRRCPLLLPDGRCSVHDCKPTVCALYPLGRVALFQDVKDKDAEITRENIRVKYIINDYNCGSAKKRNTVRSWLAQFQIPEEDEFFIRWNVVTVNLSAMVRKLEENNCSEHTLQMLWNAILFTLYVDYDTKEDFMPQFEKAEEYLLNLCRKFRDMTMVQRPDTDGAEAAAKDLEPANV